MRHVLAIPFITAPFVATFFVASLASAAVAIGKIIYSYDIKTAGKSGIDEVHVDAMTGAVINNVHETPADEKAEAAKDAKAKKKPASPTNKP